MKRLILTLTVIAVAAVSCQKDVVLNDTTKEKESVVLSATRSYDEALKIAEDALSLLEGEDTRSAKKRVIKRTEGQTVMRPVTRGSETTEEPIMYVFNNENDEGFTVVAADRSHQPLIAVTEEGNYTYGEPTGVEPFDLFMDNVAETYAIITPPTPGITPPEELDSIERYKCVSYNELREKDAIIKTEWGQDGIYGSGNPNGIAGCVTVGIAQIMGHYKVPSYISLPSSTSLVLMRLDWDTMLLHNSQEDSTNSCTTASHSNITTLMRKLSLSLNSDYYYFGTYAKNIYICPTLSEYGYNGDAIETISAHFLTSYKETIYDELDNDRPMLIGGTSSASEWGNHLWIIDGYYDYKRGTEEYEYVSDELATGYRLISSTVVHTKLLHFNWGYDGMCNGYFVFDNSYNFQDAYEYDNSSNNEITGVFDDNFLVYYNIKPKNN